VFETLKPLPPDAILGIMTLFRADPHPGNLLYREPAPGDWGLMIALGPGFAAEGALLRW